MASPSEPHSDPAPNRLINETSPYLLQHAHNPVDWHPWGDEAFALAAEQDKPVFLSVGYSACHWCHVMEHESFEDAEIAELMNDWFVNIKVDREERPDIDQIYMSAVQLMTQRGGWPMSVFLTPERRPFYGGTYWPPVSRMGMPGFREILRKIHEIWSNRRDEVTTSADSLTEAVGRMAVPVLKQVSVDEGVLRNAAADLLKSADRTHGGFGGAPKFPHPMDVRVLLRSWNRFNDQDALDVAMLTLDKMARGGMCDHLGGGFHRYSTDARWLVPHFEKMLYDNALLVPAYLEAYQATGQQQLLSIVQDTLDYVLREMQQPEGGFYSTQDADSEGVEGKFFVWSEAEVDSLLPDADAPLFKYCYDITSEGNWERTNILNRPKPHQEAAAMLDVDPEKLAQTLERCREKLFAVREQRVKPGRDDKVLVAWNGWMISALAMASRVTGEARYAEAAARAAEFILHRMRDEQGHLLHSYKDGRARFNAYLDDYAALIEGLVDLYQATFEAAHLGHARDVATQMIERFADEQRGGFYFTSHDHERLITRTKDAQDNATPSGNAQAATALLKLGRLCGRVDFIELADQTLSNLSGLLAEHPLAAGQGLLAADMLVGPACEVVIVDGDDHSTADRWIAELNQRLLPNIVVARHQQGEIPDVLRAMFDGRTIVDGRTAAYVCQDSVCGAPVTELEDVLTALEAVSQSSAPAGMPRER